MVEDPVLGLRLEFERGGDGDALRVEMWIEPGGGVSPHVHPAMEERFEVIEGEAQFLAGRTWRTAGPGETVVVARGTRHAFRNRSGAVARVRCVATPPSSLEAFLTEIAALARAGRFNRYAMPTSLRGLLEAIAVADRHRDMVVLLFPPMPPAAVQRVLFPPLARLARRRYAA